MKYIIVEKFELPIAILFNEILQHSEISNGQKVLGAGFCRINNEGISVFGHSQSLGINARSEDAKHIKSAIEFTAY